MASLVVNDSALKKLTAQLCDRFGGAVQTGPLKGMKIDNNFVWDDGGNAPSKFVGCYEFELHDAICKAAARKPDTVINAGCAEGYYAVGLGRLTGAKVYAIDMNPKCIDQCARNAMLNGIFDMALVDGKPGARDLMYGEGRKLYFVDIEGYEVSVLDPVECPDLLKADIIVECHDFLLGDSPPSWFVTNSLCNRFAPTHDIDVIYPQLPRIDDFPFLRDLPIGLALLAITELHPYPTAWLACWSKQGEGNG